MARFSHNAPVAQLDRAPGFEPVGWVFESPRARLLEAIPCPSHTRETGLKILKIALGFAFSLGCGYLAVRDVVWSEVVQAFRFVDLGLLILSTLWLGLVFLGRAYRWQLLLAPVASVPVSVFFSATLIGFMGNNLLPLRAGELLRLYALARLGPVSMSHALATGTLDRVFDMLLVSLLLGLGLPLIPALEGYSVTNALFLSLVVTLLGSAWFLVQEDNRRWVRRVPRRIQPRVEEFLDSLQVMRSGPLFLKTLALSTAIWGGMVIYFWLLLYACAFSLPIEAALVVMLLLAVGVALPAAPGFIGVFQYAVVLALSFFSVPKEEALSFSIVAHLVQYVPITLGGLFLLLRSGLSLWPSQVTLAKNE